MPHLNDRIRGGIYGALVGDALGVPVEFSERDDRDFDPVTDMRGFGTWSQPPGTWSDDGSLLLCSVEALQDGFSPRRMADGFVQWVSAAHWSARGSVFDIGNATRAAIQRLAGGTDPEAAGGQAPSDNGNGSLMRILPLALRFAGDQPTAIASMAARASRLTHAHPRSCLACAIYCVLASRLLAGETAARAHQQTTAIIQEWQDTPASELPDFARALSPGLAALPRSQIASGGYVVETLEAAIWCLLNNTDYSGTVLSAVNLGGDTDTTGCVAGGLAGVLYGIDAIPTEWLTALPQQPALDRLITDFASCCKHDRALQG